jgi:hypothetical protein
MTENNKPKQSRKGKTNNPHGRPAGTPNKATIQAREAIALFVDGNAHRLSEWLDKVAEGEKGMKRSKAGEEYEDWIVEPNPAKAFELFQSVVEYHVPKLARTEVANADDKAFETVNRVQFEIVNPQT